MVTFASCNNAGVAGEAELYPEVGEPGATMGGWSPAAAEVHPQLVNLVLYCIACLCLGQSLVSKLMVKL